MKTKTAPMTKHRRYRIRVKAKAIALKGGRCERCGFDDARALRMHHTKPLRRTSNGMKKKAHSSSESHAAVVQGRGRGLRLLCANCSCIDTSKDWTLNVNVKGDVQVEV